MKITVHIGKDRLTIDGATLEVITQLINCITTTNEGATPEMRELVHKLSDVRRYLIDLDGQTKQF